MTIGLEDPYYRIVNLILSSGSIAMVFCQTIELNLIEE